MVVCYQGVLGGVNAEGALDVRLGIIEFSLSKRP